MPIFHSFSRLTGVVLLTLGLVTSAGAQELSAERARSLFVDVERVSRLPKEDQKEHVRRMYHEVFPAVSDLKAAGASTMPAPPLPIDNMTPDDAAARVLEQEGVEGLRDRTRRKVLSLLARHPESVKPLVKSDLRSLERSDVLRGLSAAGRLQLQEALDGVLKIFRADRQEAEQAALTLRDLNDPRAIRALVERDKNRPTQYYELIRPLQRGRSADPALVKLLRHKSAVIREQAAYALTDSGDPDLASHVRRLVKDADARVRGQAAEMGFALSGSAFEKVRPSLTELLHDPERAVRLTTATGFAQRQDATAGPTLLTLLRDATLDAKAHGAVVRAIQSLTGTAFGYDTSESGWQPGTENNRQAIRRFEEWIRRQGALNIDRRSRSRADG
ncbi:MAG: HEAT repeat domain-containing protein [Armatimonadota bacterium]